MRHRSIFYLLGLLSFSSTLVFACSLISNTNSSSINQSTNLTISAAASLKTAMEKIQYLYGHTKPRIKLIYNFGSSGSLQKQIEHGAPIDVFISAATDKMDALEKQGLLLENTRKNLLKNNIVLIVPKEKRIGIKSFRDLSSQSIRKIAMGEPKSVPIGHYAQQVLKNLKIFEKIKPKVVFARDVRQVLYYVETGNVDAGIVYASDMKVSKGVELVADVPVNSHSPVLYPVAAIKSTKNAKLARELIDFLFQETSGRIFKNYGFELAE
ncbi:Molybdenum ABC transporter, periplasmic molybdenum-binding protein ModA (TC 3.A.1.8.1) [Richelia intracellularis HH01]|uniref:Molybdenum ABC transporter, periplasmic molybdenum-binding protein ModA (TC 3.A.1.8.1) n=1 Tax=Richelia intracellularis HH01 TaxID=1165094 RepID=M1X396_9NOST|nr:Molybdenum ABC transporter, periplasmic molybdenum-binding protein ModA (TC 3.A.1.8.1) [Richelia intracellularis HH01]